MGRNRAGRETVPRRSVRVVFAMLLVAVSFTVMFLFVEAALRVLGLGYAYSRVEADPILHHVHPPGFSYITKHPSGEYGGHRVAFDAEGRVMEPGRAQPPAGKETALRRVAFLGDSFVEALQVPYRESFVGLLEAAAIESTVVVNFAVSSYSPILYLLQWRTEVQEFKPDYIFLLLYGNDVRDDGKYGRKAVYDETGELQGVPGPRITWWKRIAQHSYALRFLRMSQMRWQHRWQGTGEAREAEVGGHLEENPDLTPATVSYLESLRWETAANGTNLVVMAVPSKYALRDGELPGGTLEFADKVATWAREAGVPYIDLAEAFRAARRHTAPLFFDEDIHFTAAGNQVVAKTVARAYPNLFASSRSAP